MKIVTDFLEGEEIFEGFSQGTLIIFLVVIGLSIGLGVLARRYIFPRLMYLFSKTERIDGKTLFAPVSLGKNRLRTETAGIMVCSIFSLNN